MGKNNDYERGQRDHNSGNYERPHSVLGEMFSTSSQNREGWQRNESYDAGWKNACDTAKKNSR